MIWLVVGDSPIERSGTFVGLGWFAFVRVIGPLILITPSCISLRMRTSAGLHFNYIAQPFIYFKSKFRKVTIFKYENKRVPANTQFQWSLFLHKPLQFHFFHPPDLSTWCCYSSPLLDAFRNVRSSFSFKLQFLRENRIFGGKDPPPCTSYYSLLIPGYRKNRKKCKALTTRNWWEKWRKINFFGNFM